jgi:hypothetical protein
MPKPVIQRAGDVLRTLFGGLAYEVSEYDPIHRTHVLRVLRGDEVIHIDRLELVSSRARSVTVRAFEKKDRGDVDRVLQFLHAEHKALLPALLEEQEPIILNGEDIEPEEVRWLWMGRYPRRKPVILEGDPGLGKSLLSLDLSARLSVGYGMPDGTPNPFDGLPAATVILSAEDDPADTILPRFLAAGGDPRFLRLLKGIKAPDGERFPNLADVPAIRRALESTRAKLLIIDPLSAYVPAQSDVWRDDAVRRLLLPISVLVAELDVGLLLIRHLTKDNHKPAIYRGQASIGLTGAARSEFVVGKDPGDTTGERRCVATVKFNIGKEPPTLAYTIVSELGAKAHLRWEKGTVPLTADELLNTAAIGADAVEDSAIADACAVLEQILESGPVGSKAVYQQARQARVAKHTLERAKAKMGVRSAKDGADGSWRWHIPEKSTSPTPSTQNLGELGDVGDVGGPARNGQVQDAAGERASSPSSPTYPTSGALEVGDLDFLDARVAECPPPAVCSNCGEPEGEQLGRLIRLGDDWLHLDCSVPFRDGGRDDT